MDVLYRITLRRPNTATPWGFRLRGGLEAGEPLTFKEVHRDSIADNCGIRQGDQMVALAGRLTAGMSNADVQDALVRAGVTLEVIVERPCTNERRREGVGVGSVESDEDPTGNGAASSTATPTSFPAVAFSHLRQCSFARSPSSSSSYSTSLSSAALGQTGPWSTRTESRRHSSPSPERASFRSVAAPSTRLQSDSSNFVSRQLAAADSVAPTALETVQIDGSPLPAAALLRPSASSWLASDPDRCGVRNCQPQWQFSSTDFIDELFDGSRRVRFAEPLASEVIDHESVGSVDWESRGGFRPGPDSSRGLQIDRLSSVERNPFDRLSSGSPLAGFDSRRQPGESQASTSWRQFDDAFRKGLSPAAFDPGDRLAGVEMRPSPSGRGRPLPLSGHHHLFPGFSSSASSASRLAQERTARRQTADAFERLCSESRADSSKTGMLLDPMRAGLFAVLDRSITDKIVNWNRPPDLEHSATYQLLKEMESARDDY